MLYISIGKIYYNMEIWKDIKGFVGYYQISNYGNIRSIDRVVNAKNGSKAIKKGKEKKAGITNGYRVVLLSKNNYEKGIGVHRLVAEYFVKGKTKERDVVNHIDGNKLNNNYSNLEWCTQKENIEHSYKYGLQNPKKGEEHHFAAISNDDVFKIRDFFKNGVSRKEISEIFKVSYSQVCRIIKGNSRV